MKRPPFKILPTVGGVYRRDGRFVVGGKLSWAWENLVTAVACGVDGVHEIRRGKGPWYRIDLTVEEAEAILNPNDDVFGRRRVNRARRFRETREAEAAARAAGPWTPEAAEAAATLRAISARQKLTDRERFALAVLRRREINEAIRLRRARA